MNSVEGKKYSSQNIFRSASIQKYLKVEMFPCVSKHVFC